jgi:hypothetical protein
MRKNKVKYVVAVLLIGLALLGNVAARNDSPGGELPNPHKHAPGCQLCV